MASIFIHGVSGRFPESQTVEEFADNLFEGRDMITTDPRRWDNLPGGPPARSGRIKVIDAFDSSFFGVHAKQASTMDPQLRLLLETSFEALCDAGISPDSLRGTNCGVYVGSCFSDAHELFFGQAVTGYENTGCAQSMFANRLSFFFDLRGPSMNIDTACSSGLVALVQAVNDLRSGLIDRAIVGGSSILLNPQKSKAFEMLKMLSPTGACRSFDAAADGYARSEGVAVLVLSRVDSPNTAYLQIVGEGCNSDGYTPKGITFPSATAQSALIDSICGRHHIDPLRVKYVECHGTGTVAGDGEELAGLAKSYRVGERTAENPLYIGSVKSNMGHCEGGSGIAGLVKLCIAAERKKMPANIHFSKPNQKLLDLGGSCRVVAPDPLAMTAGDLCAVSSFGFGGTNAHVVVSLRDRSSPLVRPDAINTAERWLSFSPCFGRTEEGVAAILRAREGADFQTPLGPPLLRTGEVSTIYPYRGTCVQGRHVVSKIDLQAGEPPVWFVFGGNGCQWLGMAKSLYDASAVFHQALDRCIQVGRSVGVDLAPLLIDTKDSVADSFSPAHGDMGLAAVQISLVEMMRHAGIKCAGTIGHSAGETVCGYVDGGCTLEQAILIAHARATCVVDFPDILGRGLMAAVGLDRATAEQIVKPHHPHVVVGCHNSPDGVTLSGRVDVMKPLLEGLKEKGVFVRQVETRGMAFHSPMLAPALGVLRERLAKILPDPKPRTASWISSCFLDESASHVAQTLSAEYHVHNFSNPVEFAHAVGRVPAGAVVLELSPHAILANPIRRTRTDVSYVGVMKMNESGEDTVRQAMAQLWNLGVPLHPARTSVVERPLIAWDRQPFPIPRYGANAANQGGVRVKYDLASGSAYLLQHNIDGRPLMPAASYLYTVWTAFAEHRKVPLSSARLSDVLILQAVQVDESSVVSFEITFGAGPRHHFELRRGAEKVVSGVIESLSDDELAKHAREAETLAFEGEGAPATSVLQRSELYGLLARSGYNYGPDFQGVSSITTTGSSALLTNPVTEGARAWIPYVDSLLHVGILEKADGRLRVPVSFRQVDFFASPALQEKEPVARRRSGDIFARQVVIRGMQTDMLSRKASSANARKIASLLDYVEFGPIGAADLSNAGHSEVDEYCAAVTQALRERLTGKLKGISHLQELDALLNELPPARNGYQALDLGAIAKRPQSIWLRMILDILSPANVEQTLKAPIQAIVKHPEHGVLYSNDLALGMPLHLIEKTLRVVEENVGDLDICEIGCGTCGLTRGIVRRPSIRRYLATDVSPAFLANVDTILGGSDLVEKGLWDVAKPLSADLLKGSPFNLIVASNALHTANSIGKAIENACAALQDNGFLLAYEWTAIQTALFWGLDQSCWQHDRSEGRKYSLWTTPEHWNELFRAHGMQLVLHVRHGDAAVLLARKMASPKLTHKVIPVTEDISMAWAKDYLASVGTADRLWLVGSNEGLPGLVRCLRKEPRLGGTRAVVVAPGSGSVPDAVFEQIRSMDMLINHVDPKKDSHVGCFVPAFDADGDSTSRVQANSRACAVFTRPGDLSQIEWFELSARGPATDVDCRVLYSALNFKDVMLASGKLNVDAVSLGSTKNAIGFEFSGIVESQQNRRVMGFGKQTFATHVKTSPDLLFDVPAEWSLLDAATVPTVYATVYYSLFVCGGFIGKGQSILIHAGAGGVGQAAIRIALARGADVYTTCNTNKRQWLLQQFPGLKEDHIGSSRDTSFEEVVMRGTNGAGVDLVLNSLSGDILLASIRCLRQHGRFLEIGKYDMMKDTRIGMSFFLKNCSFFGIDVSQVFDMPVQWQQTRDLIADGIRRGEVKPLPVHEFSVQEMSQAFHFMGAGKHTGKVVVNLERVPVGVPLHKRFAASRDGAYLVTGGLGGVGLELCHWLVARGASHIVVTSRRGVTTGTQALAIKQMEAQGARVEVSTLDVADEAQCRKLIDGIPRLLGVFHLAMVLQDTLLQNMTQQQWDDCVLPKARASRFLDAGTRSRKECSTFVVFSSVSAGLGNAGQSNYGFGNSVAEAICRERIQAGLHAIAIQWGMIGDVGYVANLAAQGKAESVVLNNGRFLPQPISDCFDVMERWLTDNAVGVATSYHERQRSGGSVAVSTSLIDRVAAALGMNVKKLDTNATFQQLGCDSIQIIEIQSLVENATNAPAIPVEKLMTMRVGDVLKK